MTSVPFIEPLDDAAAARAAHKLFVRTYGHGPAVVWAAPGRVNLIGEHTDYNGGLCLPIALPHRTYVALAARDDDLVRVVSDVDESAVASADLQGLHAGEVDGWSAYPVGVAWALRTMGFADVHGFDAAFVSCVPLGSGLSSSAAMTCSTALALDDVYGLGFGDSDEGRMTLINAAISAENDMAGASTGGLDQNASMRCSAGHAIRLDCKPGLDAHESVKPEPFDLQAHGLELLVLDTCAPHQLNDGQYEARRRTCEQACALLGVATLREIADEVAGLPREGEADAGSVGAGSVGAGRAGANGMGAGDAGAHDGAMTRERRLEKVYGALEDDLMMRRVRHVISEIGRVDECIAAFQEGDMRRVGQLFNASHDSLRDDYEVTIPELDVAVNVARQCGAYGARMTGGGFGGSIIALVDAGRSQAVAQAIADEFARRGFHEPRALAAWAGAAAEQVA
ncbi:galactokinase [Bifidobacterium gallicum]|uniref:Galactokinase n=1 Tax=Bifidobacterium gallicum DSM 20093 = LMG 11596 TaxID=561180 RepID=D1NT80_9BIFI|nr:galactokinase [Bifidobacterium gallicum]EFA23882.1 galactokinase [Bifidobacterium gallicum DSM 20093 = LMG 11596]KFI59134.1 galactokinase [Bifidobacterium gallicum DSM 20093 = LMG 11596]